MEIKDFTQKKYFPGTNGNPFDVVLDRFGKIQKIPVYIFFLILGIIAYIPTRIAHGQFLGHWIFLWLMMLGDWILLTFLPIRMKSYGPPQPPVILLACLRAFFGLFPDWIFITAQLSGTLLVIYGFWIEPHSIKVTHQVYETAKIPRESHFTVLHIGDIHVERVTQRENQLNQLIKSLKPDLILFSGDFLNLSNLRDPIAWESVRSVISEWSAPKGIFAVTGSPAVDLPDVVPNILKDLPLNLLENQIVQLNINGGLINIIGVTCSHKPFEDGQVLSQLKIDPDCLNILLYHSPDLAPQAAQFPIDLQFSGHTHGGQVRLPIFGAFFTGSLYGKKLEAGRYLIDQLTLYITRGVGMEGKGAPRVRFLCPPEIILWTIKGV